jgi:hypothetical protein
MQEIFNDAVGLGQEEPRWTDGPFPLWGRSDVSDGDESPGDTISQAIDNYTAVMQDLYDMSQAWGMIADATEEWDAAEPARLEAKARDDEARRRAFEEELAGASILQRPLRISRPVVLRKGLID